MYVRVAARYFLLAAFIGGLTGARKKEGEKEKKKEGREKAGEKKRGD